VKYFLCRDEQVIGRLPNTLHKKLLAKTLALPELGASKQKILEIFIATNQGKKTLLDARGSIYSFDPDGFIDVRSTVEWLSRIAEGHRASPVGEKVIDAGPVFRKRQWEAQETWKPSPKILRAISADLMEKTTRIPAIKALQREIRQGD
jgi:hypothetical protein